MSPTTVIEGVRLTIRLLESELAWRESTLDFERHLGAIDGDFPPGRIETLDRMAALRAVLVMNRAELELLLTHPEVTK